MVLQFGERQVYRFASAHVPSEWEPGEADFFGVRDGLAAVVRDFRSTCPGVKWVGGGDWNVDQGSANEFMLAPNFPEEWTLGAGATRM